MIDTDLNHIISEQASNYDSFYLYDESSILRQAESLKTNFPSIDFLYSVKCNPNPHVMRSIFAQGFGADAASLEEVMMSAVLGLSRDKIYYSAPGKTEKDIQETIGKAVLIADSVGEIEKIQTAAERLGIVVRIGIRINPDFTFQGDEGIASKFGIDEDLALTLLQRAPFPNVKITGIHIHLKSQELDAAVLAGYYRKIFRLAERVQALCTDMEFINMGSGIGVSYALTDAVLDLTRLGNVLEAELTAFRRRHPGIKVMIEVGRYAVCKSGFYVTKVLDRKVSYGKTYLVLKNTLNGFLRPSLAQLILRYTASEAPGGCEPLFTSSNAFEFLTLKEDPPSEQVTLVGNLCTAADVVAEDLVLPHLECGDCIIITNAGSYAAVLSPMQFSAQEKPVELFFTVEGKVLIS